MSRLIDADKIDFNEVFVGASEFAQDTRNAAQMLIDEQPTAFDVDRVLGKMHDEMMNSASSEFDYAMYRAIEIMKGGGIDGQDG